MSRGLLLASLPLAASRTVCCAANDSLSDQQRSTSCVAAATCCAIPVPCVHKLPLALRASWVVMPHDGSQVRVRVGIHTGACVRYVARTSEAACLLHASLQHLMSDASGHAGCLQVLQAASSSPVSPGHSVDIPPSPLPVLCCCAVASSAASCLNSVCLESPGCTTAGQAASRACLAQLSEQGSYMLCVLPICAGDTMNTASRMESTCIPGTRYGMGDRCLQLLAPGPAACRGCDSGTWRLPDSAPLPGALPQAGCRCPRRHTRC